MSEKLITPELLEYYQQRHKDGAYGTTGARNAGPEIARTLESRERIDTILDYGCGTGTLGDYMLEHIRPGKTVYGYDPAIPGWDLIKHAQYDAVVCTDVLEHVEPELTNNVLDHIFGLAKHTVCLYIATDPCGDKLPDGRDIHVNLRTAPEWRCLMVPRRNTWRLMEYRDIKQRKRGELRGAVYLVYDKIA